MLFLFADKHVGIKQCNVNSMVKRFWGLNIIYSSWLYLLHIHVEDYRRRYEAHTDIPLCADIYTSMVFGIK